MANKLHHYSQIGTYQFVTFRTQASVDGFVKLLQNSSLDESNKQLSIDQYLDHSNSGCILNDEIIKLTKVYCQKLDPEYYRLIALSVMPNHVHILFEQLQELSAIMKKLKGGLAHSINKEQCKSGTLWARDYFDKAIRNELHYLSTYRYIKNNAIAAGLIDAEMRFWGVHG